MEKQGQTLKTEFVDRVCEPRHRDFIRVVHWNIEKGKRWHLLERCLESEDIESADILCLNEADYGMARSGNRHVAFEIAQRLSMRAIFAPSFYECTKGVGDERLATGENAVGQHGNAVLTRLRVVDYRNVFLPSCNDTSKREEKRAGGRTGLIVQLQSQPGFRFTVVATHLEVYTTRKCRAAQMEFLLNSSGEGPAIVAGDFNTNTFDRGSLWHTVRSLMTILGPDVKRRVARAWETEPLFGALKKRAFSWEPFNDATPTSIAYLTSLEDRKYLPGFIVRRALERGSELPLRLDWIACRGFKALTPGHTLNGLPAEPSDHLPITCDLVPV